MKIDHHVRALRSAIRLFICLAACFSAASTASAVETVLQLSFAENTTFSGLTVADHQVAALRDDDVWQLQLIDMTSQFPDSSDLDALSQLSPTDVYFSLDTDARLSGTLFADEDVIHWDGIVFTLAWAGAASGVPASADLDALEIVSTSPLDFMFSLDVPAYLEVDNITTLVGKGDVVHFNAALGLTGMDFDASAAGVPDSSNLDALSRLSPTRLVISFDTPGKINNLTFDDADLVVWNVTNVAFENSVYVSGAINGVVSSADMDAVESNPEHLLAYNGRPFGDFDNSHCTDILDFLFLLDNWQLPVDGVVMDLFDFLALLDFWQTGSSC